MQNKPSVKDILDSKTREDALKIIDSLSKEQVLATYDSGHNILHALVANYGIEGAPTDNLYLKAVVDALVAKNRAILDLRLEVTFTNPITNKPEYKEGDTPLEAAIRQNNLALVKILDPHYEKDIKIFDHRPGEQRAMTPEEIEKLKSVEKEAGTTYAKIKTVGNITENVSPLAFAMRYGQFEMFKYFLDNGFGSLKGIDDLSKYKLENPSKENLEKLYRDLFIAGESEVLKGLHRYLGYYEGHEGKNSEELNPALSNDDKAKALELISQGHYVYDFSALNALRINSPAYYIFLETLNHPNYNIAAKDIYGNTPLHVAANYGRTEVVKAILEVVKDKPELLQSILLAQSNVGYTPLDLAANIGSFEVVKAMLEAVKDNTELLQSILLAQSNVGYTQLHLAALNGRTEVVTAILEVVKDKPELLQSLLIAQDKDGNTPFHDAAWGGSTELVKAILEFVKDKPELLKSLLIAQDKEGSTPLHNAAEIGDTEVVKAILEFVKDKPELLQSLLIAQDKEGKDALNYAESLEIKELINYHLKAISDQGRVLATASSIGGSSSPSSSTAMPPETPAADVDITEFYYNQAKEDASKKRNRDEAPESNKMGRK